MTSEMSKWDTEIVLADGHPLVREALQRHFEPLPGLNLTAGFGSISALLAHMDSHEADVAIFDCFQPEHGMDAESLLASMRAFPSCRIVVFSAENSLSARALCTRAGADAFVDKREPCAALAAAVHAVVKMPRDRHVSSRTRFIDGGLSQLTRQEQAVMQLVALGLGTLQISSVLQRAPSTISTHKFNAMAKLQVSSELEFLRRLPRDFRWPARTP